MRKTYFFLMFFAVLCSAPAFGTQNLNPLSAVAEYNLNANGSFATGDVMDAYGDYFKWASVPQITPPNGYHVPQKAELMTITGLFSMDDVPRPPYPLLTWKIDKEGDEEVMIFGETMTLHSHYYGTGKQTCYALRFMGGDNKYLSAYRWELIPMENDNTKTRALKVTCRLLGAGGSDVDVKSLAEDNYWTTNNEQDVVRYFPTAGYGDYTDGKQMDQNVLGRYWSITPRDATKKGAWGFGFDNNIVIVYYWISSSSYSVRCFKDKEENVGVNKVTGSQERATVHFNSSTGLIQVNGAQAGSPINLFNMSGALIMQHRASETNCTIDVSSLPTGVYFVESGGKASKIFKK